MKARQVAFFTAALMLPIGAALQPAAGSEASALRAPATSDVQPSARQAPRINWYQDPIAVALGLIALFAIGDIALMVASRAQRDHRAERDHTATANITSARQV